MSTPLPFQNKDQLVEVNIDFNEFVKNGKYYLRGAPTGANKPCNLTGFLEVFDGGNGLITQIYTVYSGQAVYCRGKHPTQNWLEWELVSGDIVTGTKNPNVNWNDILIEGISSIYTIADGTTLGTGAPTGAYMRGTLITINPRTQKGSIVGNNTNIYNRGIAILWR